MSNVRPRKVIRVKNLVRGRGGDEGVKTPQAHQDHSHFCLAVGRGQAGEGSGIWWPFGTRRIQHATMGRWVGVGGRKNYRDGSEEKGPELGKETKAGDAWKDCTLKSAGQKRE